MPVDKGKIGIFLDRDGTISEEVGYVCNIGNFSIYEFSSKAIKNLNKLGVKVIVTTNQGGIAKGLYTEETVNSIHKKMKDLLEKDGAHIDAIYYCPHHSEGIIERYKINCICRKPKIGMLLEASKRFNVKLDNSFVIGDKISDVETGYNSGAKSILVMTGFGKDSLRKINENNCKKPNFVAENLLEASEIIYKEINKIYKI